MKYHLDLFTPETWAAFREAGSTVTGFRERHRRLAEGAARDQKASFLAIGPRPLYEQRSFLSYDSIDSLAQTQHFSHMSDSIIAEYEESSEV